MMMGTLDLCKTNVWELIGEPIKQKRKSNSWKERSEEAVRKIQLTVSRCWKEDWSLSLVKINGMNGDSTNTRSNWNSEKRGHILIHI